MRVYVKFSVDGHCSSETSSKGNGKGPLIDAFASFVSAFGERRWCWLGVEQCLLRAVCSSVVGVVVVIGEEVDDLSRSGVLVVHSAEHGKSPVANAHLWVAVGTALGKGVDKALAGSG